MGLKHQLADVWLSLLRGGDIVAAEKCPLCQSRLKNGECESCGYRLPDEGDISALYNYDPSDYPQEQPAVREITPEYQMEEIYPGRPEPLDFKVRDSQGQTVAGNQGGSYYRNNGQYGQYKQTGQYGQTGQNNQNGQPYQTYYNNNGQYGQYQQKGQYGGQGGGQQNYYGNNGQYGQYQQRGQYGPYQNNNGGYKPYQPYQPYNGGNYQSGSGDFAEFFKKFWWLILIMFLLPFPFNVIVFAVMKKVISGIEPKFQKLLVIVLILSIILPPY